ncbi:MAG: WecB/TagA/CpsF family glycosyltransferase [Phycisphaerae bacterium]|nr:WecB/TagA/CpsF family glycosyltransferase [Phycisphaerae bacterium]
MRVNRDIRILGVALSPLAGPEDALAGIRGNIDAQRKTYAVAVNPEKICAAQNDPRLRDVLNAADLRLCDGIGAALAARLLYGQALPRVTGVSLFFRLVAAAAENGWRIFLLGASKESNDAACRKLTADHPALRIAGHRDGYFEDDSAVIDQINASGADVLFVALGSPRQEFWIAEHRERIEAPFCMGIGGTLDVVSGKAKWAPALFRKTGTEWLYRLIREPRRWRRQLALPRFAWRVLKARLTPTPPSRQSC